MSEQTEDGSHAPITTIFIGVILVAVYLLQISVYPDNWFEFGAEELSVIGGLNHTKVFQEGQYFRLFTAVLMHGGIFHLVLNLVALFMSGVITERLVGSRWLAVIFIVGGLFGSIFSLLLNSPRIISVGASGAIMAVFASGLVLLSLLSDPKQKLLAQQHILRVLIPALLPFLNRHGETIDFAAHLGGAVAGFLLGYVVLTIFQQRLSWRYSLSAPFFGVLSLASFASILLAVPAIRNEQSLKERLSIADSLREQEKHDEAIVEYLKVTSKVPNSLTAHIGLATSYIHKRAYAECQEEYRIVTELLPPEREADLRATFHSLYGTCAEFNNQKELAAAQYQYALQINPADSSARMYFAGLLKEKGDAKASLANYLLVPTDKLIDSAITNMADLYFDQKEFVRASFYYKEAFRREPQDWSAAYNLALSHKLAGKTAEAKQAYTNFLNLGTKSPSAEQIKFIERAKQTLQEISSHTTTPTL